MRSVLDNAKGGALSAADTVVLTLGGPNEKMRSVTLRSYHRETHEVCFLHDISHIGLTYYISLLMNHHSQIFKYFC